MSRNYIARVTGFVLPLAGENRHRSVTSVIHDVPIGRQRGFLCDNGRGAWIAQRLANGLKKFGIDPKQFS
jgi:hypothetical protein